MVTLKSGTFVIIRCIYTKVWLGYIQKKKPRLCFGERFALTWWPTALSRTVVVAWWFPPWWNLRISPSQTFILTFKCSNVKRFLWRNVNKLRTVFCDLIFLWEEPLYSLVEKSQNHYFINIVNIKILSWNFLSKTTQCSFKKKNASNFSGH